MFYRAFQDDFDSQLSQHRASSGYSRGQSPESNSSWNIAKRKQVDYHHPYEQSGLRSSYLLPPSTPIPARLLPSFSRGAFGRPSVSTYSDGSRLGPNILRIEDRLPIPRSFSEHLAIMLNDIRDQSRLDDSASEYASDLDSASQIRVPYNRSSQQSQARQRQRQVTTVRQYAAGTAYNVNVSRHCGFNDTLREERFMVSPTPSSHRIFLPSSVSSDYSTNYARGRNTEYDTSDVENVYNTDLHYSSSARASSEDRPTREQFDFANIRSNWQQREHMEVVETSERQKFSATMEYSSSVIVRPCPSPQPDLPSFVISEHRVNGSHSSRQQAASYGGERFIQSNTGDGNLTDASSNVSQRSRRTRRRRVDHATPQVKLRECKWCSIICLYACCYHGNLEY